MFVVEDDPDVNRLIRFHLEASGYVAEPFSNTMSALARARIAPPALFLLDIMLPGEDGLDFCQRLRRMPEFNNVPIIFITAKISESNRVEGLECGADDYITKPFSPREMIARVKAALQKERGQRLVLRFGELEVDTEGMHVRVRGTEKALTTVEFRIIQMLAQAPGRVFSRDRIIRALRNDLEECHPRVVDSFVCRLRAKIEDDPRRPHYLQTVRGAGYRFCDKAA